MRFLKQLFLFAIGGVGYVGLELLWRGWSHVSMFAAGGCCFLLLGNYISRIRAPLFRGLLGAGVITVVELAAGLLSNRSYKVWDYRDMPLNYKGHICLGYSILWIPVSLAAIELYKILHKSLNIIGKRGK